MEATENRNRTATHNDVALTHLAKNVDLGRMEVYYQFCNNTRCREITMLVLPANRILSNCEKEVFANLSRAAQIPGIILEYPKQDGEAVRMTAVLKDKMVEQVTTWDKVLKIMATRQETHEAHSTDRECSNYSHTPQPVGKWNTKGENYRFSNEARRIPGVRHLDTDGVFYCLDCMDPVFIVEATSDGCPNTRLAHKHKNTKMTRKVAAILKAEALLIQHEVGNRALNQTAYLTTYEYENMNQVAYTWDGLADFMENSGTCGCVAQAA